MSSYRKFGLIRSKKKLQNTWQSALQRRTFTTTETSEIEVPKNINEIEFNIGLKENSEERKCNWELWSDSEDDDEDCGIDGGNIDESRLEGMSRENALLFIASVFIQNNVSRNLAKDIFTCFEILRCHASIKLIDVKKVMEEWATCDCRVYSFCVCCSSILPQSKKCTNKTCSRYSISQSNVSAKKTVITFSLRQQVKELMYNGCFGPELLTRTDEKPSLSGRLCETRKYQEKLRKCGVEHLQHYHESESADKEKMLSISMGQMFLTKMAMIESKSLDKIKASVNSLSSSFANQTKTGLLVKRTLDCVHVIEATGRFPRIDITDHYNKSTLVGETAVAQMIQLLMKVFKTVLQPNYSIWYYSYRPNCVRATDQHFLPFPEEIAEKLIDFAYDAVGISLPPNLLHGPIDSDDPFLITLNVTNPEKEINRRREERDNVSQTMRQSISHALNYLRDNHYCTELHKLENCKKRSQCISHLTWKDVKFHRMQCRQTCTNPDSFDAKELVGFFNRALADTLGKKASRPK